MRNLAIAFSLVCVASAAQAGDLTPPRRVDVRVVEGNLNVLPGATIELTSQLSPSGQRPAVAITDSSGRAHFEGLTEGKYVVRVQLSGFADVSVGPFAVHEDVHKNPQISEFVVLLSPVTWVDEIVQQSSPQAEEPKHE